jgi:hypothetical protein
MMIRGKMKLDGSDELLYLIKITSWNSKRCEPIEGFGILPLTEK